MTDFYKFAAQNMLRFPSTKGDLTVEQLFHLPLTSKGVANLDNVAKTIYNELKAFGEVSFVEDTSANPRKEALTVALEIVKDVIATKQAENRAALAKSNRTAERKKILDAMAAKKDETLSKASMEDLEKQLAALDA